MTRWKWRARKIPESPPERKSEMKPSAKSIAVLSWMRAFQSVPSQLTRRIVAGSPSEEAKSEKTNGEKGFMPLEKMCWPQTQKPKTPTPHSARTTRRSFQTGLRENVETKCVVRPKHGSTATYTSACAKNQKRRCQRTGTAFATSLAGCLAMKFSEGKKCALKRR